MGFKLGVQFTGGTKMRVVYRRRPIAKRWFDKLTESIYRLYYGSQTVPIRVYRLIEDCGDSLQRTIVYENTQLNRFCRGVIYGGYKPWKETYDLGDARSAINDLTNSVPIATNWATLPDRIEETYIPAVEWRERLNNRLKNSCFEFGESLDGKSISRPPQTPHGTGGTGVYRPEVDPGRIKATVTRLRRDLDELCKRHKLKDARWKQMETVAG
ncbi:MAG TPA: hypothetical protein VEZ90_07310, partial [Blastocatellia bacterium]|nr:hypothetical protein [Blastocatellia bacterium]